MGGRGYFMVLFYFPGLLLEFFLALFFVNCKVYNAFGCLRHLKDCEYLAYVSLGKFGRIMGKEIEFFPCICFRRIVFPSDKELQILTISRKFMAFDKINLILLLVLLVATSTLRAAHI
jgi:hypothetical protein